MATSKIKKSTTLIQTKSITFTYSDYNLWTSDLDSSCSLIGANDANYLVSGTRTYFHRIMYCNDAASSWTALSSSESPVTLACSVVGGVNTCLLRALRSGAPHDINDNKSSIRMDFAQSARLGSRGRIRSFISCKCRRDFSILWNAEWYKSGIWRRLSRITNGSLSRISLLHTPLELRYSDRGYKWGDDGNGKLKLHFKSAQSNQKFKGNDLYALTSISERRCAA